MAIEIKTVAKSPRSTDASINAGISHSVRQQLRKVEQANREFHETTENPTQGEWHDGKQLYRTIVNFGALPNATVKAAAHGIASIGTVVSISGYAYNPTTEHWIPIGL